jgi:hypothetical protein
VEHWTLWLAGPTCGKSTLQATHGPGIVFDLEQSITWHGMQETHRGDIHLGDSYNWEATLDFIYIHHHCVLPTLLACRAVASRHPRVCVLNLATPQSVATMELLLAGMRRLPRCRVYAYAVPLSTVEERIVSRPVGVLAADHGSYGWTVSRQTILRVTTNTHTHTHEDFWSDQDLFGFNTVQQATSCRRKPAPWWCCAGCRALGHIIGGCCSAVSCGRCFRRSAACSCISSPPAVR